MQRRWANRCVRTATVEPNDDIERAVKGYQAFRETTPRRARYVTPQAPPGAVWRMGACEFVGYMTTHNGKPALYVHEFATGSRPFLYAGPRQNQLFFVGGRFKVTGRGITDLDKLGRVTEAPRRFKLSLFNHNRRSRSR